MATFVSSWMFARSFPSAKTRQPASSSSLLILMLAVASLCCIGFLSRGWEATSIVETFFHFQWSLF